MTLFDAFEAVFFDKFGFAVLMIVDSKDFEYIDIFIAFLLDTNFFLDIRYLVKYLTTLF